MADDDQVGHLQRRPVRLVDVARAVGVSVMTVSNVINGRLNSVSADTTLRVRAELKRLNYRPNAAARSLRHARTHSVGMLIVNDDPAFLAAPFTTHLVAGLSNFLTESSYSLTIQGVRSGTLDLAKLFPYVALDGICAYLSGDDRYRARLQRQLLKFQLPIVVFQDQLRVRHEDCCAVRQDDRQGGRLLGTLLLECGARRLLMVLPRTEWPALNERESGVRDAMKEVSGASLRVIRTGNETPSHIFHVLQRDFATSGRPDAVVASNDQIAIGALMYARRNGIDVPNSMFITGFNGFEFWHYTEPHVASIKSNAYEIGARGGEELLKRIETGEFDEREIAFPVEYLEGNTV